jgi:GT2 family glycosyltransferase
MPVQETMSVESPPEPPAPGFEPVRIVELDIGDPMPNLHVRRSAGGLVYGRCLALVRLHAEPLALVEVELQEGSLRADILASKLWPAVADRVARHLEGDQLGVPSELPPGGLTTSAPPACVRERDEFLARAPALTVLVPSRERPERLARCLDSILACDYPADRLTLIVVDNAPTTERTRFLVREYAHRADIRYLREDATGSASARNRGLREVLTDLVAMTDDDTVVDRWWLLELARTFSKFPEAAAVSGLLVPMELDSPPQLWFEQFGGFSRGFDRRVFDLDEHWPADEPLYPWTAGVFGTANNFAFRTAALREIGAFDPALGNGTPALGGVDTEIMLRTIVTGHTIVYEPRALVHHAHRVDYAALRRQIYGYGSGLVAVWLKTLTTNPALSLDFVRKAVPGLRFALSTKSSKNSGKRTDYPSELTKLELWGMLYGPIAYARSRRRYGRHVVPRAKLPPRRPRVAGAAGG